ncbi:MAG TPA: EF-P lysine aminoacylase EpmA [Arenimonas sp.]|nr:EF-P lysine aminoacylase EpmA [Arenimonas sp.]
MNDHWQPSASGAALKLRAGVYRRIRDFFHQRHVLEVETPILSEAGNTDPNIESFHVQFSGPCVAGERTRWLRTSPEFPMKRLLASGFGDCYELGRVFRNGEFGRRHNPEFTMLEWYRIGWSHVELIEECILLVQDVFALKGIELPVRRLTYAELFMESIGIDPHLASDGQLREAVLSKIDIEPDGLQRDDFLDLLVTHCIEPKLPKLSLTAVSDFPASQCALARIRPGAVPVAERFELYLGDAELANGYHELTDAQEQGLRFDRDLALRSRRGACAVPKDQRLLSAMESMPACAGVAMGIDRLMMALSETQSLPDVVAFDFSRA